LSVVADVNGSLTVQTWVGHVPLTKAFLFAALFVPALATVLSYAFGALGPRPLTDSIDQTGLWTIRFLLFLLAITPLRQLLQWPQLLTIRRMIGVAAFFYGAAHITLYAADSKFIFSDISSEIVRRFYLTLGFTTLIGLAVLAMTSTDSMFRRLGTRRWRALHRVIYAIGAAALIHFFIQSKADVYEPTWMAGLFGWLIGYRLVFQIIRKQRRIFALSLLLLSAIAGVATALGEALYFWLKVGIRPVRVLTINFSLVAGIRPSWIVLLSGIFLTSVTMLRRTLIQPLGRSGETP
jgi:methionine sulfoxide reductase heme-binding subunit